MPSGARTMEHGRPLIWPIIQPPTASKYRARSSLVTGAPSPPSGHSALSGFEMTTPITSEDLASAFFKRPPRQLEVWPEARAGLGVAISVMAGFSAVTSFAGLSWRSPLNDAWRTFPSPVQPA